MRHQQKEFKKWATNEFTVYVNKFSVHLERKTAYTIITPFDVIRMLYANYRRCSVT